MAKTIADYGKLYEAAKKAGDAAGMQAASDGANAIRTSQGQATVNASSDIKNTASKSSSSSEPRDQWTGTGVWIGTPNSTVTTNPLTASPGTNITGGTTNNSITDALKAQYEAQQKALQAQIDNAVAQNEAYIPQAQQITDDANRSAYVTRELAKAQTPESLGAMGITGGMSESALTGINNTFENSRTANNQSLQDALNSIAQNSANIQATGNSDLASLSASYQGQLASALQAQQQLDMQAQQQEMANYEALAQGYGDNYQAEINRLLAQGVSPDDYRILTLNAQRNQKISNQAAAEAEAQQQALENEIAYGTYLYNVNKPYYKPISGGGSPLDEPNLTAAQAKAAFDAGLKTDEVLSAMDYYYGTTGGELPQTSGIAGMMQQAANTGVSQLLGQTAQSYISGAMSLPQYKQTLNQYGYDTDGTNVWQK